MQLSDWQQLQRVLVVRLDNIGDIVMLTPALRALRQSLPDVHLTLLATPSGSQIAPLLPWINEVITHRPSWQDISNSMPHDPEREQALVTAIRTGKFDAALIFTSFTQSPHPPAYVCYQAGIPIRVGQSKEFGGAMLSHWVKPLSDVYHQVDRNLHLMESAGFTVDNRAMELQISAAVQESAGHILQDAGIDPSLPFIVLAPGASCDTRRYDGERFAAAMRSLSSKTGLPVVIVGSDKETVLAKYIMDTAQRYSIVSVMGRTSVPEMAAIIRSSHLVIANNSGPLHIADAFKRPTIALYSGADYEQQWRPRYALSRVLYRPVACSPCHLFKCPGKKECLDIPPDEIVRESIEVLQQQYGTASVTGLNEKQEVQMRPGQGEYQCAD